MDFTFVNELSNTLGHSNIFKFTIVGAKSLALALVLFKVLETYLRDFDTETPKVGNMFAVFGYALLIMSSDWIITSIEHVFAAVDTTMASTPSNLYTELNMELVKQYNMLMNGGTEMAWYDYITIVMGNLTFYIMYLVAILLMALCKIADLSVTAGYLLSRMFLIQLMKFIFPLVIALSTLDITKDLLSRWIKRYIGLFVLGIAYIGIIHFTSLVQNALVNQFAVSGNTNSAINQMGALNAFTWGMLITIIVVFTVKVKLFSLVTNSVSSFFS